MMTVIQYHVAATHQIKTITGTLFFGDAILQDFVGVKIGNKFTLVPMNSIIQMDVSDLDEELFTVNIDSMKRSKEKAMERINNEFERDSNFDERSFQ